jgi:hypothetical protein
VHAELSDMMHPHTKRSRSTPFLEVLDRTVDLMLDDLSYASKHWKQFMRSGTERFVLAFEPSESVVDRATYVDTYNAVTGGDRARLSPYLGSETDEPVVFAFGGEDIPVKPLGKDKYALRVASPYCEYPDDMVFQVGQVPLEPMDGSVVGEGVDALFSQFSEFFKLVEPAQCKYQVGDNQYLEDSEEPPVWFVDLVALTSETRAVNARKFLRLFAFKNSVVRQFVFDDDVSPVYH